MDVKRENRQDSLVGRFAAEVSKTPDKIAISTDAGDWTYSYLHDFSSQIAGSIAENYDDRYKLSKRERTRYARQMLLDGWGIESQEKLKATTVFVAGCGGSGSPLMMQLALCGVGNIIACDFDEVDLSNLNRQCLHDESRIGVNKAISAQMTLNRMNPNINVIVRTEKITRDNVFELVGNAEIIFDNVDDLETKFILSECAVAKGIPHIISSMIELSSYVAIFHTPHTPCLHCIYDKVKVDNINEMKKLIKDYKKAPIPVASPSLFTSTGFAVNEAIKILLGLETPAYNTYFLFNQKSTKNIVNTEGFKMISYPFNEHFRKLSKEQGFDWDEGFRGKFVEEIHITPDPTCPVCGKKHTQSAPHLATQETYVAAGGEHATHKQVAALLVEPGAAMAASLLGVLKSGKTCIFLDVTGPEDKLDYYLLESEARLIITNNRNAALAQSVRDKVNKNIKIINIDTLQANLPKMQVQTPDHIAWQVYDETDGQWVEFSHTQLLHLIDFYTENFGLKEMEKLMLAVGSTAEKSAKYILSTLNAGATLSQKGIDLTRQENYWLSRLEDFAYTDLPRKTLKASTNTWISKQVSLADLINGIDEFCHQQQMDKYDFYLTVFNLMILKETNQNDITIGIHLDQYRDAVQKGQSSGFLNTLIFRSSVLTGVEFREYLHTIQKLVAEARQNQDYPYEKLIARVKEEWNYNGSKLASLVYNYLPGKVENLREVLHDSGYDFSFYVLEDGAAVKIIYNGDVYEEYIIERNLAGYRAIIETVLTNEAISIRDIELQKEEGVNEFMLDFDDEFDNDDLI